MSDRQQIGTLRPRQMSVVFAALAISGAAVIVAGRVASADSAPKRCKATQVTRVVGGVRTCVPQTLLRVRPSQIPNQIRLVDRLLTFDGPPPRRRRGGAPIRVASASLVALVGRRYPSAANALAVGARDAIAKKPASREHATVTQSPAQVSTNADGSMSASSTISASEGGATASLEMGARVTADGSLDLSVGLELTAANGSSTANRFSLKDVLGSSRPTCPTVTGAIPYRGRSNLTGSKTQTLKEGRATLGTIRSGLNVRASSTSDASLAADASLRPIPFTITAAFDYSRTATALAFLGSRFRMTGSGTYSGTIDPRSGLVSGASMTVTGTGSGYGQDTAEAAAASRSIVEQILRDEASGILSHLRTVESNARGGKCTRIVFNPPSPGTLGPNAEAPVRAGLYSLGLSLTQVPSVRWSATPAKGRVSPTTSETAEPTFTVTGAAQGPETARIVFRATSPAGISEATWVGREEEFPRTYAGTVSAVDTIPTSPAHTETWSGSATYTLESAQTLPGGIRLGRYRLTGGSLSSHVGAGGCTHSAGAGGSIVFGDLDIQVDPSGRWTSAFVYNLTTAPIPITCGPTTTTAPRQAYLGTRVGGTALRPMPARGPIAATNVTDTAGNLGPLTQQASWNLAPSE